MTSGAAAEFGQCPGGALVLELTLGRGKLVIDGVAHERMHEPERRLRPQDLRGNQRARRVGNAALIEARERCGRGEARAVAEHRDRAGDRDRFGRQPSEPQQDRARHGPRPDLPDRMGVRRVWLDPFRAHRLEELSEQQRIAARRAVTGGAERALGSRAEAVADHLADRILAERRQADRHRRRVLRDLPDQPRLNVGFLHPRCRHDEHTEALEPSLEIREEPQRRMVRPVQIVDRDTQGALRREVCGQPEQPVQGTEAIVASRRRLRLVARTRAWRLAPSR